MALAFNHLGLTVDTDGNNSISTTVSVSANALVIYTVQARNALTAEPVTPTISGTLGLTWTLEESSYWDTSSSSRRKIFVFRAVSSGAASGTIVATFSGQNNVTLIANVDEYTGADITGTNGSNGIPQSVGNLGNSSTPSVTLAAFGSTNNHTYGVFGCDGPDTWTVGSGFTQVATDDDGSGLSLFVERKDSNDTGVDCSLAVGGAWGGIALEIKEAAGGTDVTATPTVGSATFSIQAPTVSPVRNVSPTATVLSATFSSPASSVSTVRSATVSPTVLSAVFTSPVSTVSTTKNVTASATVLVSTFSLQSPTVSVVRSVTYVPTVLAATFSSPASSVSTQTNITVSALVLAATFSVGDPTISAVRAVTISPTVLAATFSAIDPTVSAGGNVTVLPTVLAATFSTPTSAVIIDQNVSAAVLAATFSIQAPTITVVRNVSVSATVLAATFSIVIPSISATSPATDFDGYLGSMYLGLGYLAGQTPGISVMVTGLTAALATFSSPSSSVSTVRHVAVLPTVLSAVFSLPAAIYLINEPIADARSLFSSKTLGKAQWTQKDSLGKAGWSGKNLEAAVWITAHKSDPTRYTE